MILATRCAFKLCYKSCREDQTQIENHPFGEESIATVRERKIQGLAYAAGETTALKKAHSFEKRRKGNNSKHEKEKEMLMKKSRDKSKK